MVLIKHDEFKTIPKSCKDCLFCTRNKMDDLNCLITEEDLENQENFDYSKERHKECPLLEVSVALKEKR